jgi:hypothetical protein
VTLTNEQQTRIRENIFVNNRNVPRVDRVNFSIRVGAVVPSRVRVVEVPSVLIDIHPEWRSHLYFVAEDEIYIMDRGRRIVATVPVGQSNAQLDGRGSGGRSAGAGSFSVEEIRQVQMVLVEEGFMLEVDGRLGTQTRDALTQFQRRNGLEVTGQIDSQTMTKLGVNIRGDGQGGTTGRGGDQSPSGRGSGGANQDRDLNQSPDDGGRNQNRSGNENTNQRGTTGQGGGANRDRDSNQSPDDGGRNQNQSGNENTNQRGNQNNQNNPTGQGGPRGDSNRNNQPR